MTIEQKLKRTFNNMNARCRKQYKQRKDYLDRGITVCDEWEDFLIFFSDMAGSFSDGLSLDRKNNDKGYSKENCQWVGVVEQLKNRRAYSLSGKKGVYFCKNRIVARITIDKRKYHVGTFSTIEKASEAFNKIYLEWNGIQL